jgi:hypothetical protein
MHGDGSSNAPEIPLSELSMRLPQQHQSHHGEAEFNQTAHG